MADHPVIDVTELATVGEQFPLRLMQLGFRLMQVMEDGIDIGMLCLRSARCRRDHF